MISDERHWLYCHSQRETCGNQPPPIRQRCSPPTQDSQTEPIPESFATPPSADTQESGESRVTAERRVTREALIEGYASGMGGVFTHSGEGEELCMSVNPR